jgi:excisionase family DNA binding protein
MNHIPSTDGQRQTLNIEEVARILGINRTTAYELAGRDDLPVPVIRLGRRMVVSRYALEALLAAQQSNDDRDV